MIFVTVGTHEQQFNRLLEIADLLAYKTSHTVFVQSGYSEFQCIKAKQKKFLSFTEMQNNIEAADFIITHGGPSTFIEVLLAGKMPIVVPRKKEFNEHINNHQVEFCEFMNEKGIIKLANNYDEVYSEIINENKNYRYISNNRMFNFELKKNINRLVEK